MKRYIYSVAVFNLFDAFCTYNAIMMFGGEELNPIMNKLWDISPHLFLLVKSSFSLALLLLSPVFPNKKYLALMMKFVFYVYLLLSVYHVYWMLNI